MDNLLIYLEFQIFEIWPAGSADTGPAGAGLAVRAPSAAGARRALGDRHGQALAFAAAARPPRRLAGPVRHACSSLRHLTAGKFAGLEPLGTHWSLGRITAVLPVPFKPTASRWPQAHARVSTLRCRKEKLLGIERVRPRTRQPRRPRSARTVVRICGPTVAHASNFVAMQQQFHREVSSSHQGCPPGVSPPRSAAPGRLARAGVPVLTPPQ